VQITTTITVPCYSKCNAPQPTLSPGCNFGHYGKPWESDATPVACTRCAGANSTSGYGDNGLQPYSSSNYSGSTASNGYPIATASTTKLVNPSAVHGNPTQSVKGTGASSTNGTASRPSVSQFTGAASREVVHSKAILSGLVIILGFIAI